jgi:glycosyltransferase involved in cell wall biosynthesis
MKLSIAICTLPVRIESFSRLIRELNKQIIQHGLQDHVEVISVMDCKGMSVGEKRNKLREMARGLYLCYIDDDDRISTDYIISLIQGIESGADVITFRGEYKDGAQVKDWTINSSNVTRDTATMQYRRPNHLCAVRREIYQACPFPLKSYGEDSDYSELINKMIRNEFHIPKKLYFYDFSHTQSQTHPNSKTTAFYH